MQFLSTNLLPVSILTFVIIPAIAILSIPTAFAKNNNSHSESEIEYNVSEFGLENSTFFVENTTYSARHILLPVQIPSELKHDSEFCAKNHGTDATESAEKIICIPKCCPPGQVLDYGDAPENLDTFNAPICQDSGGINWSPIDLLQNQGIAKDVRVFHKPLNCSPEMKLYSIHENGLSIQTEATDSFYILSNGTIRSESELIFSSEHCLDGVQNFRHGEIPPKYSGYHGQHVILGVCFPQEVIVIGPPLSQDGDTIHTLIYWVVLPFASLFLLATILVYILVWQIHNIHGYTLFSYVVSLFGNYVILFISQIHVVDHGTTVCGFIGICTHFGFLMTAAWLTVVNYDVWHTFRHLKASRPKKQLGRYVAYFSFAVGAPFLLVFISAALDSFRNEPNTAIILPNYRISCVLSNQAVAFYLYIPLAILVCANLTFFIYTIILLVSYQRSIGAVLKGTCTEKEDQSLRLFLKLFVVMGFSWIFEVIGWAIKKGVGDSVTVISTVVAIVDVFNLLLAIPIFFIFVWKKQIFDHLWIGYPRLMRRPLSLLVFCGCVNSTPEDKRPSISPSAITMISLGQNGTIRKRGSDGQVQSQGRRSTGSVSEILAQRSRKWSNDSQGKGGEGGRRLSQGKGSPQNLESEKNGDIIMDDEGCLANICMENQQLKGSK